jgi:hypothetical protein
METTALATRPLPLVSRVDPVVDLRDRLPAVSDVAAAGVPAWDWCCDLVRRFVAGPDERSRRRVVDDTIKGPDRNHGADHHQLAAVLGALDRGRPVAISTWWPAAGTATESDILGIAAMDVPPPSHKGDGLVDGHPVVALGYGQHDAFPGGGYLIVLDPAGDPGPGDVRCVPFTYVRAYAIALQSARIDSGRLRPVETTGHETGREALPELPTGPSRDPVDVQIARKARCADPRSLYTALFFSENAMDTARAKAICARCEVRDLCLARALERAEPYGVWGGEFLIDGEIVVAKRGRGRPRRIPLATDVDEVTGMPAAS